MLIPESFVLNWPGHLTHLVVLTLLPFSRSDC